MWVVATPSSLPALALGQIHVAALQGQGGTWLWGQASHERAPVKLWKCSLLLEPGLWGTEVEVLREEGPVGHIGPAGLV